MRPGRFFLPLAVGLTAAFILFALALTLPTFAADESVPPAEPVPAPAQPLHPATPAQPGPCSCPDSGPRSARPKFADLATRPLDEMDEIAALEAIRVALSEVGDGATYVWHRTNGRLSGLVRPTGSFKDVGGRVCRHFVLMLSSASTSGKIEGVACRLSDGRWQLEG
jgi:hypothetical protein